MKELKILLLEDSPTDAELIECALRETGLNLILMRAASREAFVSTLKGFAPDIILSDYNLPSFSGLAALEIVQRDYPETPVIIVTGALSDQEAASLLRAGAKDYVLKDRLARLAPAVQHALLVKQGNEVRKQAEAQLQEKTALLENVINSSTDHIFIKDRELRIILCNDVFARALGKQPEELYGKREIESNFDTDRINGSLKICGSAQSDLAALAGNVTHATAEHHNVDGEIRYFDSVKVPLKSSGGNIFGILGVSRDITELKTAEAQALKMTQLFEALYQCNGAITRSANHEELYTKICAILAQYCSIIKMAWIGLLDGESVNPVACGGAGIEYLNDLHILISADSPSGHGPTGAAIHENKPFWCQDFLNDPLTAPWHESAARFGWRVSAALPLHEKGVVVGALSLYSGAVNAFDETTRNLLIELANDISYALDNFAGEAERKHIENTLLESEKNLHAAQRLAKIGSWKWIVATNTVQWSEQLYRINGYDPSFPFPVLQKCRPSILSKVGKD